MPKRTQLRAIYILRVLTLLMLLCLLTSVQADVVKPALIEISAYKTGKVELEIRASIEALLTGINSEFKNTQQSPMAGAYDDLRELSAQALGAEFRAFESAFIADIKLNAHTPAGVIPVTLAVGSLNIPEAGYTQVPRISGLSLVGELPRDASEISLLYPARYSDYAVRVRQVNLKAEKWHWSSWDWVRKERASKIFSLREIYAQKTRLETITEFIPLGFLHILPKGLDHILFILGLFLFCRSFKPLLWQITMFTVAHTVTLGLATAAYIELSARIVEPLIALSIAYVGFENVFVKSLGKHRLFMVFAFGLLHGLGFASVLSEFELPKDAFFTSLLSFNIGVELGQLAIITGAWLLLRWWMKSPNYRRLVIIPGSLIIGVLGAIWTLERLNLI